MNLLLNMADIESLVVKGYYSGYLHAWNIVKINGEYYHLDATADDPPVNEGGIVWHRYFNLSDTDMAKDHGWETGIYPVCNNYKYNYMFYSYCRAVGVPLELYTLSGTISTHDGTPAPPQIIY